MVKENVLFGCKREEYICFKKKLSFDIELMRNHILTFHKLRLELYFFFFSIDRINLLFLKKKVFHDMHSSDFLITFHRSKFLKTSYSLKKNNFQK